MNDQYNPPKAEVGSVNRATGTGLTTEMIDAMRGTKPWVLLIGIVLMISAGFMLAPKRPDHRVEGEYPIWVR